MLRGRKNRKGRGSKKRGSMGSQSTMEGMEGYGEGFYQEIGHRGKSKNR